MKPNAVFYLFWFVFNSLAANSLLAQSTSTPQGYTNPVPPAPNVAALARYGDIPIGQYTGIPDISVPLFNIKVKELNIPITASYNASGIRVSEEASFIGLGWSLNAGGMINQVVNGLNDFQSGYAQVDRLDPVNASYGMNSNLDFMNGYSIYNTNCSNQYETHAILLQDGGLNGLVNCVESTPMGTWFGGTMDNEPDFFSFNFLNYSGKFFFNKQSGKYEVVDRQNIKIDYSTSLNTFTMTTPDGVVYSFDKVETTHITSTTLVSNGQTLNTATNSVPVSYTYYLSKILLITGEQIILKYNIPVNQVSSNVCTLPVESVSYKFPEYNPTGTICAPTGISQFVSDTYYMPLTLASIAFPQGRLKFIWDTRLDILNSKRLTRIDLYDTMNNSVISSSALFDNSSYFQGHTSLSTLQYYYLSSSATPCGTSAIQSDQLYKRLKLTSITVPGVENPYTFTYDESISLPSKLSRAQDYWDYYNGNDNATTLFPDPMYHYESVTDYLRNKLADNSISYQNRSPNANSKAWLLSKLNYPTGGSTEFYYENNTYQNFNQDTYNRHAVTSEAEFQFTSQTTYQGTGVSYFTLDREQQITLAIWLPGDAAQNGTDTYHHNAFADVVNTSNNAIVYRLDYVGGGFNCTNSTQNVVISLPAGSYKLMVSLQDLHKICGTSATYSITAAYTMPPSNPVPKFLLGPGQRIARVVNTDDNGHSYEKNYKYEYNTTQGGNPVTLSYGRIMNLPLFFQWYPKICYCGTSCFYEVLNEIHGTAFNSVSRSAKGNYIGYDRVIEINGTVSNNIGRIEYNFLNYPDICQKQNPGPCISYLETGKPNFTDYYNQAGVLVKRDTFSYYVDQRNVTKSYGFKSIEIGPDVTSPFETRDYVYITPFYPIKGYRFDLQAKKSVTFDLVNFRQVVQTTNYDYYSNGLLKTETSNTSDGGVIATNYSYPQNFAAAPYSTMALTQNWIEPVVEKTTTKVNGLSSTVYHQKNNYSTPSGTTLLTDVTNSFGGSDQTIYQITAFDAFKNPVQIVERSGITTAYKYDKTGTFPIARAVNATSDRIFYTSFEDNTGTTATAKAGAKVWASGTFNFTTNASFSPANTTNLKMSYWYYSSSQWNFSGELPFASSFSNGILLDEIRVYPAGAQMTTYVNKFNVGIMVSSDPNNVMTFYEYDTSNRLKNIKDDKGNIVKHFDYHYKTR